MAIGSTLWAAPVAPNRWFDAEQLRRSRAYHAPVARAAMLRLVVQAAGLVAAFATLQWSIGPVRGTSVTVALLAGAAVALAVWLPRLGADIWMEYRHEPAFGSRPVPVDRFMKVALASTTGVVVFGAVVASAVHLAVTATPWWPIIGCCVFTASMALIGPVVIRRTHRSIPLEPAVEAEFRLIAASGGIDDVAWGQMVSSFESGMNALSLGGAGSAPSVLCSQTLLDADPALRDFVVAHEIGHLRRGHHGQALAVSLFGAFAEVIGLWAVDRWILERLDIGVADPRNWPVAVGVLAVVGLPVGMLEAWRSRAHERQADLDGAAIAGMPGLDLLRSLHEHDRSDLDPGLLGRVFAQHPPPAERLMRAERFLTTH